MDLCLFFLEVRDHPAEPFGERFRQGSLTSMVAEGNGALKGGQAYPTCFAFGQMPFDQETKGLVQLAVDKFGQAGKELYALLVMVVMVFSHL